MLGKLSRKKPVSGISAVSVAAGSEELKKANEELYKKSAELAFRNKTLSLLDTLYGVATQAIELGDVARDLTREIIKALGVPYCAIILFYPEAKRFELVGYADKVRSTIADEGKVNVTNKNYVGFSVLDNGKATYFPPQGIIIGPFLPKENVARHLEKLGVVTTFVHPLCTERGSIGLLVIGLNREEKLLNPFEREGIMSTANVVSVAIDKTAAYEELKRINIRLKELDELKTEFMSIATHQLRTPLSIIKGYTSLMDEGAYGAVSKEGRKVLHNIDISNERLIKLVDEFLNVSRIEQGRTQFSFAKMDVAEMVKSVVTELNEKAETKRIMLDLRIEKGIRDIIADEDKLRHCVYNYIDNAIKYSPEKSKVGIHVDKENLGLQVRVVDSGVGMDKKDLDNLFQKFYRSPHVVGDYQGTGLGLFVVKKFIEAHGGRVWAKSDGVEKGSEFGFWVPLRGKRKAEGGKGGV